MRLSAGKQDGGKTYIFNLTSYMTILYGYGCQHIVNIFSFVFGWPTKGRFFQVIFYESNEEEIG